MKNAEYVGSLWEEWRPVKDYEGLYEVSNEGRVRSLNYRRSGNAKELKAGKDGGGYLLVGLWKDGKRKFHLVHRIVWEAFRGKIPHGMQINHLDENKLNNWLDNLEVCTCIENINYGTRNVRVGNANINNLSFSKAVHQIDRVTGNILNTYPSTREAERQTGIDNSNIVKCCKGNPKQSHAGGYKWRYVSKCQSARGLCPQY